MYRVQQRKSLVNKGKEGYGSFKQNYGIAVSLTMPDLFRKSSVRYAGKGQ